MLWVSLSLYPILRYSNVSVANMREPSHRHLVEQRWRQDGKLDLLVRLFPLYHVLQSLKFPFRWNVFIK